MNTATTKPYKLAYFLGLALIITSFIVYLVSRGQSSRGDIFSQSFFINYGLCILYAIYLGICKLKFEHPRPKISYGCWINVVLLFTISAFSLNQEMDVFAAFPNWLNIYTLTMVALFLAYPFFHHFPGSVKAVTYLVTGSALLLSVYMVIYLMVLVPITVISFWFFGFSLHTFVPALWVWILLNFLIKKTEPSKLKHLVWVGFMIPLFVLGLYVNKWHTIQNQVKDILASKNMQLENQLPDAIQLAQKLPSDPMTEEILLSPVMSQHFWADGFGLNGMGQQKFHDPLSVISVALFGDLDIDYKTVQTLLNIRKDYRHRSTDRLWTGISLSTSAVSNNIRIFPEYRVAYHEKTFVIHNDPDKNTRNVWFVQNTQEALYTFHVPEGSIVTSLSLWINGKEQKSRLTTNQKADSAYTTIVGKERRDPAIVHWQEGNTISVNVFPCTKEEDRTFKIGFTSPLSFKDGHMWLENIWFEGPDFNTAREATSIFVEGKGVTFFEMPDRFEKNAKGEFVYKGEYIPDWKVGMEPVPLSVNKFSFNGYDYSLKEIELKHKTMDVKGVFLDITKEWSREDYNTVINDLAGREVFTWLPEKVKITSDNKDLVWNEVSTNQFSMPFLFDITRPENTILITKAGPVSPLLSDLKESEYAEKSINYLLNAQSKIAVINIGNDLSPLWRSLHELRLIDYHSSGLKDALHMINSGKINVVTEDSSVVSLNESYMSIVKTKSFDSIAKGNAPDHLLRLFAYNDILRKVGKKYFEKEKYENELFSEAEEGYVVTPVTSMIVLESEADYERMGISENKKSVGNAGIISGGAVPEPHEWLLIMLVFILISRHIYLKYKIQLGNYFRK
ncbi:MAG: XrtN system VIT domain-containing protein [Bacteroidota bacterium]